MRNLVNVIDFVVSHGHLDLLAVQIIPDYHRTFIYVLKQNTDYSRAIAYFDELLENPHFQRITNRQISFDSRNWPANESEYLAEITLIKALLPLLDKEGILSFGKTFHEGKIFIKLSLKLRLIAI
jgi:hypothetical protein